ALDRAGLVGADGPTHHGVSELSYLRHIPNNTAAVPRDEIELKRAMLTASNSNGPFVYRYPRGNAIGKLDCNDIKPFNIGESEKLRHGKQGTIICLGPCVQTALEAAEILAKDGVDVAVIDARFLKPLDSKQLVTAAQQTGNIITIEENVLAGGFGSAVMELLEQHSLYPRIVRIGLPDQFIEQGSQQELNQIYGLDTASIVEKIKRFLAKT
ncbi:MAG: hypothetical protein KAH12_06875, partial [Anaerolineales bacterium]|nr:hypothetical protein [Anaerolineales bacterium]